MADDRLSAALEEMRQEANVFAVSSAPVGRMSGHVQALLAAVDKVLALAATWEAAEPYTSALEEDRVWVRQECAEAIREAISAVLTGTDRRSGPQTASPPNGDQPRSESGTSSNTQSSTRGDL